MAKETAEQKLLKVIENTEAAEAPDAGGEASTSAAVEQVAASVRGTGVSISLPPFVENLLVLVKSLSKGEASSDQAQVSFGVKELNRGLIILIAILGIFFVMDFLRGVTFSRQRLEVAMDQPIATIADNLIPQMQDIADYLFVVGRRNLFQPYEEKVVEAVDDTPIETKMIAEKTETLRLVGVSWLDTPESASALIENTSSGMTYFLKTGDNVNSVTVKEIFSDSVVLSFQGEETNLNL